MGRAPGRGGDRRARRRARLARPPAARGRPASRTCSSCPPASSTRRARAPLDCARRELAEEIGKAAEHWEHLMTFSPRPGSPTSSATSSSPPGLRDEPGHAIEGERIDIEPHPLAELDAAIAATPRREDADRPAAAARRGCAAERAGCSGRRPPRRAPKAAPRGRRDASSRPSRSSTSLLDFLAYLEFERGLSRNTLEAYRSDLLQYGAWLERTGHDPLAVGHAELSAFVAELAAGTDDRPPAAPATLQRKIACLRSFYRHLRRTAVIDRRPDGASARAEAGPPAAARAQPRRGRRAAAPAARDRAGRAARPRAAGDDVRLRAARLGGDRPRGRRRRPRGRASCAPAARAPRSGSSRSGPPPPTRSPPTCSAAARGSSAIAGRRACSSTSAAPASPARGSTRSSSATRRPPASRRR